MHSTSRKGHQNRRRGGHYKYIYAADDIWITYNHNTLKQSDKKIIEDGSQLTDKHIHLAKTLISGQYPKISGLQSTLLQERYHNLPSNSIQIVHCLKRHHWIVTSYILSASDHMHVYDSLHTTTDEESIELVTICLALMQS